MSRLTLANGDWVDFVDRLNYAQARRMNMARAGADEAGTIVAATVTAWAIRDVQDEPIEFPALANDGIPLEALERIPLDTFVEMGLRASDVNVPDPKGSGGRSPSSPRDHLSPSRRSSRKPISSQTTQAGHMTPLNGHPQT